MSKTAVCIIGSPREHGSTALLVDRIAEGMQSQGVDVRRHALGQLEVAGCKGCVSCLASGECAQHDDMAAIVHDIIESDIVVIASPSYWGAVTSQMKAFIDRSFCLHDSEPSTRIPKGKVGVSAAIRAGSSPEENRSIIATIEHYFGHLGIRPVGSIAVEGVNDVADLQRNASKLDEAFDLGVSAVVE